MGKDDNDLYVDNENTEGSDSLLGEADENFEQEVFPEEAEKQELFRKEVWLSIYNLYVITKEQTTNVKKMEEMFKKLINLIQGTSPPAASLQAATQPTAIIAEKPKSQGVPWFVYAIGGLGILLILLLVVGLVYIKHRG